MRPEIVSVEVVKNVGATIPKYMTDGAVCFDIFASEDTQWSVMQASYEFGIATAVVHTGLKFAIPRGFRMDIYPRSGWGFKHNIQLANGTGKIDSDYRGEVLVKLIAFGNIRDLPKITAGTRIAQGEINRVISVNFMEVEDLVYTKRGEGGFGSTGYGDSGGGYEQRP